MKGVVAHSVQFHEEELTTVQGIPVSCPARTWCELGALLDVGSLVAAGDRIIHSTRGLITFDELGSAILSWRGSRGRVRLREAYELLHDRSESPQESMLRLVLVRAGLSGLSVNQPITTSSGHRFRAQYRHDLTRAIRLQADGWTIVQIGADDMRDPDQLLARIRSILATAPSRHEVPEMDAKLGRW
ncbi:hypothetical protein [Diaminobutyricibacter sp. McL0608]|uniref:hypothetical protein n=1 Tax=Leifsonia sp. McL0608 TaxID=3143537 RepID=UPI0031F335C0